MFNSDSRLSFQRVLERLNPDMVARTDIIRPDGDVELSAEEVNNFRVPDCPKCGSGILKPSVVFFGDNVPVSRVNQVRREVSQCDRLLGKISLSLLRFLINFLVIGSSLYVFSAYRFINQAKEARIPIGVINIGPTRADKLLDLKIEAKAGDILPKIVI